MTQQPLIRHARHGDAPVLVALVNELAEFEGARDQVEVDEAKLNTVLFGDQPSVFCDVAEIDGEIVGLSIWFITYSTWTGAHGIYLEDLYVRPAARRAGIAKALIATLGRRAVERGYLHVEWSVLDWNVDAIKLYESVGAFALPEWTKYRLNAEALRVLARSEADPSA